ncbi:MAG: winged helix-turn-helix domain-containing protein [Acidimicrobiales bacterium]
MALLASMEESGFRCLAVTGLGRAKDACSFQRPDVALIMCSSCAGCRRQGAQYRPWDAAAGLLERLGQLGTPVVVASDGPEAARLAGCGDVAAVLTGGYGPADLAGAARLVRTTTVPLTTDPLTTDPLTTDLLAMAPTGPRAMGSVLLDVARGVVSLGGRSVELTAKELAALTLLVAERGNLVTTEAVLAHVWPSPTTATKGDVYSLVYRVRRRVDDLDRRPPLIRSRRGLGYLLDPHVLRGLARDRGAGKGFGFLGAVL